MPVEGRECILQPDAELSDDRVWAFQLLLVFGLCEVIISESSSEISNVPSALIILVDIRLLCVGECVFVEGVGNELPGPVSRPLSLENILHI